MDMAKKMTTWLDLNIVTKFSNYEGHILVLMHSQVSEWTHLRVHQSVVAESWDSEGAPNF
jgi:hypothetical protein